MTLSHFRFSCRSDNDLYRVLAEQGQRHPRFDAPDAAIAAADAGGAVLLLADGYPQHTTPFGDDLAHEAAA